MGYQKMSFLCTAERRTHVTDKTLDVGDVCLSVELFSTSQKEKIMGQKNLNPTYSTIKYDGGNVSVSMAPLASRVKPESNA